MAQDVIITEEDCGTMSGIDVTALVEGGETIEPLEERILGRVSSEDIYAPGSVSKKNQKLLTSLFVPGRKSMRKRLKGSKSQA